MTNDEYKGTTQVSRDKMRKTKVQDKLQLSMDIKGNKKRVYKYIRRKKMTKEGIDPLFNREGMQIMDDTER